MITSQFWISKTFLCDYRLGLETVRGALLPSISLETLCNIGAPSLFEAFRTPEWIGVKNDHASF